MNGLSIPTPSGPYLLEVRIRFPVQDLGWEFAAVSHFSWSFLAAMDRSVHLTWRGGCGATTRAGRVNTVNRATW